MLKSYERKRPIDGAMLAAADNHRNVNSELKGQLRKKNYHSQAGGPRQYVKQIVDRMRANAAGMKQSINFIDVDAEQNLRASNDMSFSTHMPLHKN